MLVYKNDDSELIDKIILLFIDFSNCNQTIKYYDFSHFHFNKIFCFLRVRFITALILGFITSATLDSDSGYYFSRKYIKKHTEY